MTMTTKGVIDPELKSAIDALSANIAAAAPAAQLQALQAQVDCIDVKLAGRLDGYSSFGTGSEDTVSKALNESTELKRMREVGKGRAVISLGDLNQIPMARKTLTGTSMTGTSGVIMPQQVGGIVPLAQRRLFLRDLLYKGNKATSNTIYFVKEATFVNGASPQGGEGSLKAETTNTYTTTSLPVQTISHWLNISRQALDDAPMLAETIRTKLLYGLRFKEELEILAGDGTGYHLTGLTTSAAAFNTGLLGTSYTKLDILRRALEQVELADETPAGFFVLNPTDWATIELTKSTQGEYIVGSPGGTASAPSLWGKPVIVSTAITPNTFLAGSSESAELIDRMDALVEISYENQDNFVRNVATLLCEERTALVTYRPNAFVTGSLTSSPAS
jgi:HK97 family phage major capsid protein